jgi:hypothetical protein
MPDIQYRMRGLTYQSERFSTSAGFSDKAFPSSPTPNAWVRVRVK